MPKDRCLCHGRAFQGLHFHLLAVLQGREAGIGSLGRSFRESDGKQSRKRDGKGRTAAFCALFSYLKLCEIYLRISSFIHASKQFSTSNATQMQL